MGKLTVCILFGGISPEHEVSLRSAESVLNNIDKEKCHVLPVGITRDGKWIYFDMVPGDYELRDGEPDYTGRLVVIGTEIHEHELEEIFGLV